MDVYESLSLYIQVRLNILAKIEAIGPWMPSLGDSLLPVILKLREDDNWRIRKAVIETLPVLAESMGIDFFETRLMDMYFSGFRDRICEVRLAATTSLCRLSKVAGGAWVQEHILPKIKSLYDESSFYLIRLAVLQALKVSTQGR